MDGLRLSLASEFHHIYVFNLRGNQRTAGDVSRKEGGKIFDAGSRATVAICLLVKQAGSVPESGAVIRYRDIGDYLSRYEKLAVIADSLPNTSLGRPRLDSLGWVTIKPNPAGDWINQRTDAFAKHISINSSTEPSIFRLRSRGLSTSRDAWNYNSSHAKLDNNVLRMIDHYNSQVDAFSLAYGSSTRPQSRRAELARETVDLDPKRFSWDHANFADLARGTKYGDNDRLVLQSTYRPFHRRWAEASRKLNNRVYQLPRIFPDRDADNLVIAVSTLGARTAFTTYVTRDLPDVHLWVDDTPCFPRFVYEQQRPNAETTLLGSVLSEMPAGRRHNVTDEALTLFRVLDPAIDKDDVFFYVYGLLHSKDYRSVFAADLKKSLPRIPRADSAATFWGFSKAGRELARLHTDYEAEAVWPGLRYVYRPGFDASSRDAYRVFKMKHPKVADSTMGTKVEDRSRIVYNDWITIEGVPERSYRYELGSRSAIEWIMESWRVRTDQVSGITNDPNDWAVEHDQPTYILDLVGRVITVSMRTLDIVDRLPHLTLD